MTLATAGRLWAAERSRGSAGEDGAGEAGKAVGRLLWRPQVAPNEDGATSVCGATLP